MKNHFSLVNLIEFDGFRISDKLSQIVELDSNITSIAAFSSSTSAAALSATASEVSKKINY